MARLPIPGQDDGTWGNILNDYLSVEHNSDGTLKDEGALSAKANEAAVVHNSGDETIAGTKTFSDAPLVPTPTGAGQAANKAYVDSTASAGAADATTTSKGIVQLAGDLGGTAASPTVPGLASKEPIITAGTTAQYYRGDKSWQTLDKTAVGLANVDNTSDANKPVSTAQQTALDAKVSTSRQIIAGTGLSGGGDLSADRTLSITDDTTTQRIEIAADGTLEGTRKRLNFITGTNASLVVADDSVNNRVDVTFNAATQTAPDATTGSKGIVQLAGDLGGTAAAPTVPGLTSKQPLDSDLTTIAGLTPTNDDILQRKSGAWVNRTPAQVKTDLALTNSDVGLANVDNTSDASKPVSTAQQTAIDARARIIARGTRNTVSSLTTTIVGVLRLDSISVISGHSYRFTCTGLGLKSTVALDSVLAELRFSTSGTATTSSTVMPGGQVYSRPPVGDAASTYSMAPTYDAPSNQTLSVLLTVSRALGTGECSIYADASHLMQIAVDDLGLAVSNTGVSI